MIEDGKLAEWARSVQARQAFGWAVVQQLLEEVHSQQSTVARLRDELAQKTEEFKARSALQIVELPADCPCWRGRECEFLGPAARSEPKTLRAGSGL